MLQIGQLIFADIYLAYNDDGSAGWNRWIGSLLLLCLAPIQTIYIVGMDASSTSRRGKVIIMLLMGTNCLVFSRLIPRESRLSAEIDLGVAVVTPRELFLLGSTNLGIFCLKFAFRLFVLRTDATILSCSKRLRLEDIHGKIDGRSGQVVWTKNLNFLSPTGYKELS